MDELIEVVFKGERKEIYTNPQQFPFKIADYVIVEADKGEDLGIVNQLGAILSMKKKNTTPKAILRKPDPTDINKICVNRQKEKAAFGVCKQKIEKYALSMKLVDVEYQFDGNKITFYFTAERRVDFRELVKDLASVYKVRIELRQIGVRDEARRMGGYGVCGRRLCCTTFIKEFEPITTQCAKEQNLPLNPQKLSGICGRLMCCLMYEREFYLSAMERFPEVESLITTEKGRGMVDKVDVFRNVVYVKYPSDEYDVLTLQEVNEIIKKHPLIKPERKNDDKISEEIIEEIDN
ncbi:stage 0 sporulation family protein [candidate division KSB1 bacterium]|nr:stage 0 sporulation family protein [candidate division KSB1 bacterium]